MSRSLRWLLAAAVLIVGASNAHAQSCNITYQWPTWVGGNGFGASIDIRNTGPAITNGWSLVFNFPNGQQLQNGWPVSVTQSGTTLTAASNAAWNQSIPSNGVFNVAFNGTFSGTNNPPTAFTLNGTACTIGNNANTPPTVWPAWIPQPARRCGAIPIGPSTVSTSACRRSVPGTSSWSRPPTAEAAGACASAAPTGARR